MKIATTMPLHDANRSFVLNKNNVASVCDSQSGSLSAGIQTQEQLQGQMPAAIDKDEIVIVHESNSDSLPKKSSSNTSATSQATSISTMNELTGSVKI